MTKEKRVRVVWSPSDYLGKLPPTTVEKYKYVLQEKVTPNTKIQITCKRHGCVSHPTAGEHLNRGVGCPECGKERRVQLRKLPGPCGSMEAFLAKAKECHGDLYDYSSVVLGSTLDTIEVICHKTTDSVEHGSFFPSVSNHLYGKMTGCPICGAAKRAEAKTKDLEWFLSKAVDVHGLKYDYSGSAYSGSKQDILIKCPVHGIFSQKVATHLGGHGCRSCGRVESRADGEIERLLISKGIHCIRNFPMPSGRHIDVYCPDLQVGFEHNGLIWHSERYRTSSDYHISKTLEAEGLGIQLTHIFGDEWSENTDLCKKWILSKVGIFSQVLDVQDLELREVPIELANLFLKSNDVKGEIVSAHTCIGAYSKIDYALLAILCLDLVGSTMKIARYTTDGFVVGGLPAMLHYAEVTFGLKDAVVTVETDRGSDSGSIFGTNGFLRVGETPPDYTWSRRLKRHSRDIFMGQNLRNCLLKYDPTLSPDDNMRLNEYYKIYDCGKIVWKRSL